MKDINFFGSYCFLDDDLDFLSEIQNNFKKNYSELSSLKIRVTNNTSDIIKWVTKDKIDTLIVDLRLGNENGIDVLENSRKIDGSIKLILLTGQLISESEQIRCKLINAEFLFKGQGFTNLLNNIFLISQETLIASKNKKVDHVFISYLKEDYNHIKRIIKKLELSGINVWLDKDMLPGVDWKLAIKRAIEDGVYFIACFSSTLEKRRNNKSYMSEELHIAIEQLRKMPEDIIWFIPVKL
ncbi:MAG TPA: TIR domain-containing protein, partial [Bacteroidia bacterium]|nr:TIR domain-containing protein [Bacteroidia bacterium]